MFLCVLKLRVPYPPHPTPEFGRIGSAADSCVYLRATDSLKKKKASSPATTQCKSHVLTGASQVVSALSLNQAQIHLKLRNSKQMGLTACVDLTAKATAITPILPGENEPFR